MTEIERNSEIAWFVPNWPFSKNVIRITLQYFMFFSVYIYQLISGILIFEIGICLRAFSN